MKFTRVNLIAFLIFAILLSSACSEDDSASGNSANSSTNSNQNADSISKNANSSNDDIDELGRIIKLPFTPEEANYWEENSSEPLAGQNFAANKKMIVVMKFSPENAKQLVVQIERIKPPVDSTIDSESRFPAELIAQSQLSGDETLKGKSYAADDFLQPPYKNGKITRVENTDYFVLELAAN